ncbi:hypothetical protein SAMN05661010_00528 [Modicisalibacter muralis]|uniref:Uncharacterized protein n=1 Tax=Modicisalibacter muralis TaxID=119000 RepID=A0A1G9FVX0_9GAMM|nr:hypothetical protein [Halomonas muralis]SDK92586.1 hypothetical protein SAMN05661010_00528 [Halomonas muralis]
MTSLQAIRTTSETAFLEHLDQALHTLTERDTYILRKAANERAISFRLAMHLQSVFSDWDVDCEYNCWDSFGKHMNHIIATTDTAATEARTIYPDIVIHKRGTSQNLAAIELSKSTNDFGKHQDIKKLKAYKAQIGYAYAVLLTIGVDDDIDNNRIEIMQ